MAKFCRKCGGSGWWGARTMYGGAGGPCRACDGTGYDRNWGETSCKGCGASIDYRYDWDRIPEYCPVCKEWHEKTCANPHCGRTIQYKSYWTDVKPYCKDCRGWYEKPCENPQCNGIVRIHCDWTNPPKFCKTCGGWNEKPCSTGCGNKIRYHCEWQHPPNVCEDCKKKAKERRHSQEGASQRIESAIGWRNWSSDKRSRFHGYLARHYQVDKNYLSEGELSAIADEFEAQVGGRRW